jgi:hypothetical protein
MAATHLRGLPLISALAVTVLATQCGECNPLVEDTGTCEIPTDCPTGEECKDGRCVPTHATACFEDRDCGVGKFCRQGQCQTGITQPDGGRPRYDAGGGSSGVSGQGVISLSPSDVVDFGSPLVGQDIPKSVIVKNVGVGPLNVISAARTTGTSAEFTVTASATLPKSLAVGEEMRVNITYRLADGETDTGSITIVSDAASCDFQCADPHNVRVALFSEFKGARNLELTPSMHDFGFVTQGETSAPFSFTARNDGTQTKILTVQTVSLTGVDAVHFALDPPTTAPIYLSPGESREIPVVYGPMSQTSHAVELVVTANSDDPSRHELRAAISGRSVPTVDVSVDALDLGHVMLNQETTGTTTIRNNSNVSISVTGGSFLNGEGAQGFYFPMSLPFPITIPVGNTAPLTLRFRPTGTAGNRADTLSLTHNLSVTPVQAPVTGIADPLPPPPGGPKLSITMTFTQASSGSTCPSPIGYNAQNMDLILAGGGGRCEKPTSVGGQCPNDAFCSCTFGSQGGGDWRATGGVAPAPYTTETITHNEQGGDGVFIVANRYWDDCAYMARQGCGAVAQFMCDSAPCECYPRAIFPHLYVDPCTDGSFQTCAGNACIVRTSCYYQAMALDAGGCKAWAGTKAKTVITIRSETNMVKENRAFCLPFAAASQYDEVNVVGLIREQGYFRIAQVSPGVTEIQPNATCP